MPAGATLIEMAAEHGGSASRDRVQYGALLHAEPRMLLDKGLTLRMEDIGHLHGGPAHDPVGFRRRRERASTRGCETCSCSRGFGAACR